MKTVAEQIIPQAGYVIVPEGADRRYSQGNTGSPELEVLDFLYSFVRLIKPTIIFETGTYCGLSSAIMGLALAKDNPNGKVITLDINNYWTEKAKELYERVGVTNVDALRISSLEYQPEHEYDLMFLDSEPSLRLHEVIKYCPSLKAGGYIFIHDCPPDQCRGNVNPDHPEFPNWPIGDIPKEFDDLIKEKKLMPIYFPNPRGMMGLYKPTERDFLG